MQLVVSQDGTFIIWTLTSQSLLVGRCNKLRKFLKERTSEISTMHTDCHLLKAFGRPSIVCWVLCYVSGTILGAWDVSENQTKGPPSRVASETHTLILTLTGPAARPQREEWPRKRGRERRWPLNVSQGRRPQAEVQSLVSEDAGPWSPVQGETDSRDPPCACEERQAAGSPARAGRGEGPGCPSWRTALAAEASSAWRQLLARALLGPWAAAGGSQRWAPGSSEQRAEDTSGRSLTVWWLRGRQSPVRPGRGQPAAASPERACSHAVSKWLLPTVYESLQKMFLFMVYELEIIHTGNSVLLERKYQCVLRGRVAQLDTIHSAAVAKRIQVPAKTVVSCFKSYF